MIVKKNSKHSPKVREILKESEPSPTDVQGSYTGIPATNETYDRPVQDADDL